MGTRYRGKREEERALSAYINLMRCSLSVTTRMQAAMKKNRVTERQLAVLEALLHIGPMRQKDLAEKLLCTPGNLTSVVNQLTEEKLIRRDCIPEDTRSFELSLTDSGKRLIERIFPSHVRSVTEIMSGLSAGELETLRELCRKLGKACSQAE